MCGWLVDFECIDKFQRVMLVICTWIVKPFQPKWSVSVCQRQSPDSIQAYNTISTTNSNISSNKECTDSVKVENVNYLLTYHIMKESDKIWWLLQICNMFEQKRRTFFGKYWLQASVIFLRNWFKRQLKTGLLWLTY